MRYETFIAVKQKVIIHFPPNRHSFGSPTLSSLSSRETSMSLCLLPRLRRCSRKGAGALTLPTRTTNTREASASMWLLCRLLSSDRPSSWYGFRHMTEYYRVLQSITKYYKDKSSASTLDLLVQTNGCPNFIQETRTPGSPPLYRTKF